MPKWRLEVDSQDPPLVATTVGAAFYTHLRLVPEVAEVRNAAIERLHRRYARAALSEQPGMELEQLGLLVLQRSMLAAEDLLALVLALAHNEPWHALVTYGLPELDAIAHDLVGHRARLDRLFRLPTDEQLADPEQELDDRAQEAARRLREASARQLWERLELVATFWLARRSPAKATIHGWPIVSSGHLAGARAGVLGEITTHHPDGPFAVSLLSQVDDAGRTVTTPELVDLGSSDIALFARSGKEAAGLCGLIASAQLAILKDGRPFGLPLMGLIDLDAADREALNPHLP
jgi:hypothetical protein